VNRLMGGRLLAKFAKNSNEEFQINLHDHGVGKYIDIRIWSKVRPTDSRPSWPTNDGFMLDVELLIDLLNSLDKAISAIDEKHPSTIDAGARSPEGPSNHTGKPGSVEMLSNVKDWFKK